MSDHSPRPMLMSLASAAAALIALLLTAGTDFVDADSDAAGASVSPTLAGCATCHGLDGRSTDAGIPHLRAQNEDYLVNQLMRFAQLAPGASNAGGSQQTSPILRDLDEMRMRQSPVMEAHTIGLDNAALHDVARYYAKLPCETKSSKAKAPPQPKGSAWCNDCHAPKKVKDFTNVPSLNGQSAEYLEAQLQAFKRGAADTPEGQESSRTHHFMSRSIRSLSDARIHDIARYYAGQACIE